MADTTEAETRAALLATARNAADSLARSVIDKSDETPIETNIGSLRGLADLIGALVDDARRCGGLDCMGRSIDGTKLWITRDRFEDIERRAALYQAALRTIANAADQSGGEYGMLVDWQGTVDALSATARRALTDPQER